MSDRERLEAAGWKLEGDRWRGPVLVTMLSALAIQDAIDAAVAEAVKGEREAAMTEAAVLTANTCIELANEQWEKSGGCECGLDIGERIAERFADAIRARRDTDE